MASKRLHEPWQSMFVALDHELTQDTELHCMGGFVLAEYYGLVRATGDVDVLESVGTDKATIASLAGRGSPPQTEAWGRIGHATPGSFTPRYRPIDWARTLADGIQRRPIATTMARATCTAASRWRRALCPADRAARP